VALAVGVLHVDVVDTRVGGVVSQRRWAFISDCILFSGLLSVVLTGLIIIANRCQAHTSSDCDSVGGIGGGTGSNRMSVSITRGPWWLGGRTRSYIRR
jgi:hypothetical protein